ncbi:branched-chain amino acid ABC transporter permease/ATP-binding protein [Aldersonia kunmingensis]|uniref:branched-chain amino acid ABC transporter permease/ATP-binding protein n=1 Tax=Aldersonia kunmingensis TaxID=408066 RepID=UPI0009FF3F28|nr:branched-chain amino acid ABC transporter permease/ATP-binding protein [Aldersonia kunmingensis]
MDALTYALLGLGTGGINAILAMGLVLVYRGSGVINFAQGGFALLGAFVIVELRRDHDMSFAPALAIAIVVVAAVAVLVHVLVMRPLRSASPLARVIATLGVLTIVTQVVLLRYTAKQVSLPAPVPSGAVHLTDDIIVGRQNFYVAAIAAVIAVVLALISSRTRIGRGVSAAAENPRAAAALGWSPNILACLTWGLGGVVAAIAGGLFPATSTGFVSVTQMSVLITGALATALLAQFKSFTLALAGGLLVGVTQSLATHYIDQTGVADAVPFLFIVVVLAVRGRGLPVRGTITDRLPRVGTGATHPFAMLAIGVVAAIFVRFALPENWYPSVIVSLTFAIVGLSVVVLTGYTGQLSLAQFALGGAGAYAAGRLAAAQDWPFEAALPAGIVVAMLVGVLFGLPALRTRGVNLAVVTFGLGFALHQVLFSNSSLTGGEFQTRISDLSLFGVPIDPILHADNFSVVCVVAFVLAAIMVANVRRSRTGRRLLAVRTNERAAASLGVNVFQAKLYAFTLSAGIAGLGGVLYGFSYPTILFQQLFPPDASINALVMTVIGGVGFVCGPLLGSLLAPGGVAELFFGGTTSNADSQFAKYLPLITGVVLLLTLIGSQNGLIERVYAGVGMVRRRGRRTSPGRTVAPTRERVQKVPEVHLQVTGLTQKFGSFAALTDVSLEVRAGEVVGLLGPNGAGKTTLIDAITGYTRVSAGTVTLGSDDITKWPAHKRSRAGLTRSFQSLELFDDITVRENLLAAADRRAGIDLVTDLIHPGRSVVSDTVAAAIEELDLGNVLERRPEELSYGQRRLVAIARAVAGRPSVLLLDEPAAGLDESESAELGRLIRRLATEWGIGVLLIEHDVPMVLATADRVIVLDFGKSIASGTPAEIESDPIVRAAYLGEHDDATVDDEMIEDSPEPAMR